MKKRIIWLVVSGSMALSLVLAACAPKVAEEEKEVVTEEKEVVTEKKEVVTEKKAAVTLKLTKRDGTVVEITKEKPRYGGVLTAARDTAPVTFEDPQGLHYNNRFLGPTNEELVFLPWERGPAGTDEWRGQLNLYILPGDDAGWLAESWKVDGNKLLFRIRQGVYWALDPTSEASRLMGGRQFTANDVVWNLRYAFRPGTFLAVSWGDLADMKNREKSIYIDPDDPWTVVMEARPGMVGTLWQTAIHFHWMLPPEVIEQYGNMNDWRRVVGTGPFILKDYLMGSSLTWERNPNYWMKNPLHPEDRLPYVDRIRLAIIPDRSTQTAALRTGKIDYLDGNIEWDDAKSLLKTTPELEWRKSLQLVPSMAWRVDKPELPFYDKRVRQALYTAINFKEMVDQFYEGQAALLSYPVPPELEVMDLYIPLEKLPPSVQELYGYHPDKAKKLLAEAGYPNGFTTSIVVSSVREVEIDVLSMVAAYWAKVGVTLKIDVREPGVKSAMDARKTYTDMTMQTLSLAATLYDYVTHRPGSYYNFSMITDPWPQKIYEQTFAAYFDPPKRKQIMRESIPYLLEQAWYLHLPNPYVYRFWWPWVKDYYGVSTFGAMQSYQEWYFLWIDQELRKARGR